MSYTAIFLIVIAGGIFTILLALPMKLRKLKPNGLYGFRTRKTLSDEKIWYEANEYAGTLLIYSGIFITIASTILMFFGKASMDWNSLSWIILAIYIVPLLITIVLSLRKLKTL